MLTVMFTGLRVGRTVPGRTDCEMTWPRLTRFDRALRSWPSSQPALASAARARAKVSPLSFGTVQRPPPFPFPLVFPLPLLGSVYGLQAGVAALARIGVGVPPPVGTISIVLFGPWNAIWLPSGERSGNVSPEFAGVIWVTGDCELALDTPPLTGIVTICVVELEASDSAVAAISWPFGLRAGAAKNVLFWQYTADGGGLEPVEPDGSGVCATRTSVNVSVPLQGGCPPMV